MTKSSCKTTTLTREQATVNKRWVVIDADGLVVGRLASIVAMRLRGKHKAAYTPHVDCGDNVIVVNAEKVKFTGRKYVQKKYYHHTGYPGGIKERSAKFMLEGRFPERVVEKAVERMLPRGPLFRQIMSNLRVYKGAQHPHQAQTPWALDVGALNRKNLISTYRPNVNAECLDGDVQKLLAEASSGVMFDTGRLSLFYELMNKLSHEVLAQIFSRLLMNLDSSNPTIVSASLLALSRAVPGLDLNGSLSSNKLRKILQTVPDRLFRSLETNMRNDMIAKHAAIALAAAIHPSHYRAATRPSEATVLGDVESIFRLNRIYSFLTTDVEATDTRIAPNCSLIDVRLWNEVSFEIGGRKPRLVAHPMFDDRAGFELVVDGAKVLYVASIEKSKLHNGQFAGICVKVMPEENAPADRKVVVDLRKRSETVVREMFSYSALFPALHPT